MTNYKKILVAVDLTPEGEKVLEKAIDISKRNEAPLSLVHVVEYTNSVYSSEASFPEIPDMEKRLTDKAKANLQQYCEDRKIPDADHYVRNGTAKHEIVDLAGELEADLIVIGSHGRHGLQLLLGSTANGILHLAKCDVLAVRIGN